MSITVYPYKLTQRELEARLEPGLTVLPGQYVRFATAEPIFGQVREVRALPPTSPGLMGGYRLLIDLLYGTPSLNPQQVILMNAAQMGHEIQRLQEPIAQPLVFSPDFSAELDRLGALSVIGGDDFLQKFEALQILVQAVHPYRRIVILDPLGVFAEEDGCVLWQAGRAVRLSLQAVGSKSFLDTFGELFAPGLREAALRIVADHLPPMSEFIGFQGLLEWYSALNVPLKNLILQNVQEVSQTHIFADSPDQILSWAQAAQNPVTVLNLSVIPTPWRALFYREALKMLLEQSGEAVVPVLLYPENYLPDLPYWIQKADEAEFKLIMLASPYADSALLEMANNRFWVEGLEHISLSGSLTLGLPLTLPLREGSVGASTAQSIDSGNSSQREVISGHWLPHHVGDDAQQKGIRSDRPASSNVEAVQPPKPSSQQTHWLGEAADPNVWPEEELPPPPEDWVDGPDPELETVIEEAPESEHLPVVSEAAFSAFEGPVESPLPVVDLSAPLPEPAPEFMSASQLSQLLSGAGAQSTPPMEAPKVIASTPAAPVESGSGLSSVDAYPSESYLHLEQQQSHQAVSEALVSEASIEPVEEAFTFSSETASVLETLEEPPSQSFPPFPAPEEYEKEEFHFDLNPDDLSSQVGHEPQYGLPPENFREPADTVSQSLDEFASLDIPVDPLLEVPAAEPTDSLALDEPMFDFNLDAESESEHSATQEERATAVGSEGATILPDISTVDQELNEALDMIFPNYKKPEMVAAEESQLSMPEVKPVLDEPMAIVQKYIEPSVSDGVAFKAGDRVTHPTYGEGVVQKVIPTEESVVLNITFDTVGKRLLDPALCTLDRASVS